MSEWWTTMPAFERVFWYIAIPFTLVFVVRLIATLTGFGADDDIDLPDDGGGIGDSADFLEGFRFFTLQNFVIFFTGFGWAGILGAQKNFGYFFTTLFAGVVGVFLLATVAAMLYYVGKLAESGNVDINNALNCSARVYIPIPAHKGGSGQVQITIQGSLREIQAITAGKALPTGTTVKVVGVENNDTLLVERSS